jgi:Zn-dependent protease
MNSVQQFAMMAIPMLFAITVHEIAHGWMARWLGDDTAARMGRLSLNPIHHIDMFGTVILPCMLYFSSVVLGGGGMWMGWAKPVPVVRGRLRNPSRGMIAVALAGPGSNVLMALAWGIIAALCDALMPHMPWLAFPLRIMSEFGIVINLWLCVFNLLPLLPLDGGRVLYELLPRDMAERYARLEPYGIFIILGWLMLDSFVDGGLPISLDSVLSPFFSVLYDTVATLTGLRY